MALPARANESALQKIFSSRRAQSHSAYPPRRPKCKESISVRHSRRRETPCRNRPAISRRPSSPESAYPHPARSIRSLRNNPPAVATNFPPPAPCTKVATRSPYLPNPSMFAPASHRLAQTSSPGIRAALAPSTLRSAPPAPRHSIASALRKSTATHPASAPDSSVSPGLPAAGTSRSTNETIHVAANPSAFPSNPHRAASAPARDCRSIRDAPAHSERDDPLAPAKNRSAGNAARQKARPSPQPIAETPQSAPRSPPPSPRFPLPRSIDAPASVRAKGRTSSYTRRPAPVNPPASSATPFQIQSRRSILSLPATPSHIS